MTDRLFSFKKDSCEKLSKEHKKGARIADHSSLSNSLTTYITKKKVIILFFTLTSIQTSVIFQSSSTY